jgi:hypothetical protein
LAVSLPDGKRAQKRFKTVLRTIRLPEDLEQKLEGLAANKGIALNALVSSVLNKYVLWDNLTERFGFVTIPKPLFRDMVDAVDPGKLQELARVHSHQMMKDMMMFWFQDVSVDNFLEFLIRRGRYGLDIKVELKREGSDVTLIVTHDFGQYYTAYLKTALDTDLRTLFKIVPTIDATESSVMVKATL